MALTKADAKLVADTLLATPLKSNVDGTTHPVSFYILAASQNAKAAADGVAAIKSTGLSAKELAAALKALQ